jgi:hypothetical protein
MNMHPADVLARLDRLAQTGAAKVEFIWDADAWPHGWKWHIEAVGGGTAPTFIEAAYAVFAALEKECGA